MLFCISIIHKDVTCLSVICIYIYAHQDIHKYAHILGPAVFFYPGDLDLSWHDGCWSFCSLWRGQERFSWCPVDV